MITPGQLRTICPRASAVIIAAIADHADAVFAKYAVEPGAETCQLIAHIACETAGMTNMAESMAYSAARLLAVFPSHFGNAADAEAVVAAGPEAIANRIYGGRLGNVQADDGWRYRGQGLLDLTGRDNFTRTGAACHLDLVNHPELATDPASALEVACAYWAWRGCGAPARADNIVATTKLVQGGDGGLSDRRIWLTRVKAILGTSAKAWGAKPAWRA